MLIRTMVERQRVHGVSVLAQAARFLPPILPPPLRRALLALRQTYAHHGWLDSPALRPFSSAPSALEVASQSSGLPPVTDIASLCVALTFGANLQMLLHWEDRNSMAHSIEARVPFLDHPLVEFSLALGNAHKIAGAETKRILRLAMADVLPRAVAERRGKIGFETPEAIWFRGPLRDLVVGGTEATLARYPELLNARGVRRLRDTMLAGRKPLKPSLWRIVNLGIWGERFGVTL